MASVSAREKAYQMIRKQILRMELKPGEAINDNILAETMGISRTPVREAMIMLVSANLVVVRPQSGTFVAPIDLDIIEMEQFTRLALEKEMIRMACRRMTPEDMVRYEENMHLYEFYEHSKSAGREEKLLELDNDFHRIAFSISGKDHIYESMQSTIQHIERLRYLTLHSIKDDRIIDEHQAIAEAVRQNDPERAAVWLEQHLNLYQEHLSEMKKVVPQYFTAGAV